MTKTDIDALVMHLIEKYGLEKSGPLRDKSNKVVSELTRASISRVRRLRQEAALRYGERIEDEARARILAALKRASVDIEAKQVKLVIDDSLARDWLAAAIHDSGALVDGSFNRQLIRVSQSGLVTVIRELYGKGTATQLESQLKKLAAPSVPHMVQTLSSAAFKAIVQAAIKDCVDLAKLKELFL